jgi:hypothetical protein
MVRNKLNHFIIPEQFFHDVPEQATIATNHVPEQNHLNES